MLHIKKLIGQGESQTLDFKFEISDSRKIAKSMVAFANTNGGRLLIGVKDNGVIAGIKSDEEYYMAQAAANLYSKPKVSFDVRRWAFGKKTILEIYIPESKIKPHLSQNIKKQWIGYRRVHDQNIVANNVQLKVWKKENNRKPIKINYTRKEEFLLSYLKENNFITFIKFCKLAQISKQQAEQILTDFILLGVIEIIFTEKKIYYQQKLIPNEKQEFSVDY